MIVIEGYRQFGGVHAETASVANVLAAQGIVAPHNGKPYSEALLFGIAGGLGVGYILWEFKARPLKVIVFGWQYRWNYPVEYHNGLCARIGVAPSVVEGSAKAGQRALRSALESGQPAIVYLDRENVPYRSISPDLDGCMGYMGTVYGLDGETALLDDMGADGFRISLAELTRARDRISTYKNRLVTLRQTDATPNIAESVRAGLEDCVGYLGGSSESFALPVIKKWARMMTDTKNPKGWPVVFANGEGLVQALTSVYGHTERFSTARGAMRGVYADFLEEAADILHAPQFREVAGLYRGLAAQWSRFAASALDASDLLREVRTLTDARYDALALGEAGVDASMQASADLAALFSAHDTASPVTPARQSDLFAHMGEQLSALYTTEVHALAALKAAL